MADRGRARGARGAPPRGGASPTRGGRGGSSPRSRPPRGGAAGAHGGRGASAAPRGGRGTPVSPVRGGGRGVDRGAQRGAPRGGRGGRGGGISPAAPSRGGRGGRGAPRGRGGDAPSRGAPRGGRGAPRGGADRGARGGRGGVRGGAGDAGRGGRGAARGGRGAPQAKPPARQARPDREKENGQKENGEEGAVVAQPKKPTEIAEVISKATKFCFVIDLSHLVAKSHSAIPEELYRLLYTDLPEEYFVVAVAKSKPQLACAACSTYVHEPITITERRRLLLAARTNGTAFAVAFEAARLHHQLSPSSALYVISADNSINSLLAPLSQMNRKVQHLQPDGSLSLPLPPRAPNALLQTAKGGEQKSDLIKDMETVMPRVYKWLENASINSPAGLPGTLAGVLRTVSPMCTLREPANVQHLLHLILSRHYASLCPVCFAFKYAPTFLKGELPEPDTKTASIYEKKLHAVLVQLRECLAHHPSPPSSIEAMALMLKTYMYKGRVEPSQVVAVLIADELIQVAPDNRVTFKTVRAALPKP